MSGASVLGDVRDGEAAGLELARRASRSDDVCPGAARREKWKITAAQNADVVEMANGKEKTGHPA